MNERILVLGGPDVGKTHYTGQLYIRLRQPGSAIKLLSSPETLAPIESVLERLGEGRLAGHTSRSAHHQMPWDLEMPSGARVEVLWPDYGGEQLRDMMEKRQVPPAWVERARGSDFWLLFIRPDRVRRYEDITTRRRQPVGPSAETNRPEGATRPWADAAYLVELLQILLWVRQENLFQPRRRPRLAVLLSCWDELPRPTGVGVPPVLLGTMMPLLNSFLAANWEPEEWRVFGLSSLGKALSETEADEQFQDYGPETQGYVIGPDGDETVDLTAPLCWLLDGVI